MPRNLSGTKIQCTGCGYTWLTQSQAAVTSCPNCGNRVRLRPAERVNIPSADYRSQPQQQQQPVRYY